MNKIGSDWIIGVGKRKGEHAAIPVAGRNARLAHLGQVPASIVIRTSCAVQGWIRSRCDVLILTFWLRLVNGSLLVLLGDLLEQ
jgi:hypothetical protein